MPPKRSVNNKRGPDRLAKNACKDALSGSKRTKAASKAATVKNSRKLSICSNCKESFSSIVLFKRHQRSCGTKDKLKIKGPSINELPDEVLLLILRHLTQNELGKIARVCKRWDDLTKDRTLWENLNLKCFWNSRNLVMDLFKSSLINRLQVTVTSVNIKFRISKQVSDLEGYQELDFKKLCMVLQQKCPKVKELILHREIFTHTEPSVLDLCAQFLPELKNLILWCPALSTPPPRINYIETSKIAILVVTGSGVDHFRMPLISKLPHLKQLFLHSEKINDSWFESDISVLNQLEILQLGHASITQGGFQAIRSHGVNLKELYLCWTQLLDIGIDIDVSTFPRLETICLTSSCTTHAGVVALIRSCPSLKNVYISPHVAALYIRNSFVSANPCKLTVVKSIDCAEHYCKYKVTKQ